MRLKTKTTYRIEEIDALAKKVNRSPYHIRAVLNGRRAPGPELAAELKRLGIKTRRLRPARERWV
ncbi:MAG: hypothetical protein IKO01_09200 [Kiritimatiellae bacterium]|nr:hypothetical protein [Kiritimatiellia bacterium]